MDILKALEAMTVWELLQFIRQVAVVILCTTIALSIIFAVASALPAAYHWYITGNSDGQIAYPFFIGLTDNVCWLTYGVYKRDWRITALNIYCTSMTILYITTMYIYRTNRNDMHRLMLAWAVAVITVQTILYQQETDEEAAKVIGSITTCIQTVGATGLVFLLYKIVKSWRIDFLPFFPVALGFFIESQVFTLGLLTQDRYLMMANGFFMVMNGLIFAFFYILPADRQLVLPDLFTFLYQRAKELQEWNQKRRRYKTTVYATPRAMFDFNENVVV